MKKYKILYNGYDYRIVYRKFYFFWFYVRVSNFNKKRSILGFEQRHQAETYIENTLKPQNAKYKSVSNRKESAIEKTFKKF